MRNLKILSYNIRSCNQNFDCLLSFLRTNDIYFDILVLYETRLSDVTDSLFEIENYISYSVNRNHSGGGVKLFFRKDLSVLKIEQYTGLFNTHESIFVKLNLYKTKQIILACIYRPPKNSLLDFMNFLRVTVLNSEFFADKQIMLMGDLNVDLNRKNNVQVRNFKNIFKVNGFRQYVFKNTHINQSTGIINSLLDVVFSNFGYGRVSTDIVEVCFSDHFAIGVTLSTSVDSSIKKMKFRDFSHSNVSKFNERVGDELDTYVINENNSIQCEFQRFSAYLNAFLNRYFPFQVKQYSLKNISMPWIKNSIVLLIRKKHKLIKLFRMGVVA